MKIKFIMASVFLLVVSLVGCGDNKDEKNLDLKKQEANQCVNKIQFPKPGAEGLGFSKIPAGTYTYQSAEFFLGKVEGRKIATAQINVNGNQTESGGVKSCLDSKWTTLKAEGIFPNNILVTPSQKLIATRAFSINTETGVTHLTLGAPSEVQTDPLTVPWGYGFDIYKNSDTEYEFRFHWRVINPGMTEDYNGQIKYAFVPAPAPNP